MGAGATLLPVLRWSLWRFFVVYVAGAVIFMGRFYPNTTLEQFSICP